MAVCESTTTAFCLTKPGQFSLPLLPKQTNLKSFPVKRTIKQLAISMHFESSFPGLPSKGGGGGAGILERPNFEAPQFDLSPQTQEGGDMGWLRNKRIVGTGGGYKVLLIDDKLHTEKLVVNVLPRVVPSITPDDARNLFHQSCLNGVAVVIVAVKEHAEFYAEMMTQWGLSAAIESDSNAI